ncbi:MAG: EamA family transporter [Bacteroidales bacterium]|jgi:drug/metabolite transporter (DMT)-like permease|nr:EamA family transporter [Bacteroidales bacterium]
MWWLLSFASAAMLGCYDSFKKISLKDNAVIPVLFLNTFIATCLLTPLLIRTGFGSWEVQRWIVLKSVIVLSSWLAGYYAMKHLPLTLVGPVNATRPVLVLLGAVLLFGERLNLMQSIGVGLAILAYFLMRISGKKEGIVFHRNKWVFCLIFAVLMGALSGLYDKYLMSPDSGLGLDRLQVLCWFMFYQTLMMLPLLLFVWLPGRSSSPFQWRWSIPFISIFLVSADFLYFQALSQPGALIAVISMIRRGSAVVSFLIGAFILKEQNIKSKAFDLVLLLLSMVFLYLGSR